MNNKTLILAISLSLIGILTQATFNFHNATMQLLFTLFGLLGFFIIKKIHAFFFIQKNFWFSLVGIILLLILLFFGDQTRGAKRWFFIFEFGLQPSLLFFPFLLLSLITLLKNYPIEKISNFFRILVLIFIPLFLIFKQPDLGTSLVLGSSFFLVIIYSGISLKHLFILLFILLPTFFIGTKIIKPYQKERLISFMNPHFDPTGINYNSLQSEISIGSGGLFGKGFRTSRQSKLNFLPEAHTDFVFASFTETFGFVGSTILLCLYLLFLNSLLSKGGNYFEELFSLGAFAFIFIQFVFNVGMNLRLLPVVGVPFPLISYGGSTILTIYLLLGIREGLKEIN